MNIRHKTCLMVLFIAMTSVFALQCPTNKECHCELWNDNQIADIHCVKDNNSTFQIYIKQDFYELTVNCMNSLELSDFNLNMTLSKMYKQIKFVDCNLSKNIKLIDIPRMLGTTDIDSLMFKSYRNLNLTLEKHHLNGFENMTTLMISGYNIFHMDKDLLADLKELTSFDMSFTNLEYLPAEMFDYTPKLNELTLYNNNLKWIEPSTFDKLKNLKYLNLFNNLLTELPPGIFDKLIALDGLNIAKNNLISLPKDIFAKLKNLDYLVLSENNFTNLTRDLLQNNTKLSTISLRNNQKNFTLLDGFFSNLKKLKSLILMHNGLVTLPKDLFWKSSLLYSILLNNNYLQSLDAEVFRNLTKLEILDLNSNYLEALPDNIFQDTHRLRILNLSNNRISSISEGLFYSMRGSLNVLYMYQNLLKTISDFHIHMFYKVSYLDFSYNNISSIKTEDLLFTQRMFRLDNSQYVNYPFLQVNLAHNNIQHIPLYEYDIHITTDLYRNVKLLVGNNPFHCGCNIYNFLRYIEMHYGHNFIQIDVQNLTCHSPKELQEVRVDVLLSNQYSRNLICRVNNTDSITVCPEMCDCFLKPYDKAFIFDCSHKNLTNVPNNIKEPDVLFIQNLSIPVDTSLQFYLNFSHNRLTQMPDLKKLKLRSVDKLFLSFNDIFNISSNGLSKTTKDLELHNNKLSRIDLDVLNFWKNSSNLTHLTLHENPWECDCDARDFYDFTYSQSGISKIFKVYKVICHRKNTSILQMTWDDFCPIDITIIISISAVIALIGLIIGISFGLYYKYQEHIKIWLFAHQWCLWCVTEEDLDKDKQYDAFVSFSNKDRDFIEDELIPKLESGPRPFKLCIHYRDWVLGSWIPDSIAESVENSRRTIVVLSPNFLESIWGKMEFRAAHCQTLNEGRARVILILYGDIGPTDDLDSDLRAYISMNTYVKWGDPWFWDKLRYALPHRSRRSKSNSIQREIIELYNL